MPLQVLTFNLLAPVYADPSDFPASTAPYVETDFRRSKWFELFNTVKPTADIISLQEVTDDTTEIVDGVVYYRPGQFPLIKAFLEADYYGQFFSHDRTYWSKYFDSDPNSPFAFIRNGNALFLKKSRFSQPLWVDLAQSTGNHAVLGQALDNQTGKTVQAVAIHFDSDVGGNRRREFTEVLAKLSTDPDIINVIAGDFNGALDQGDYKQVLDNSGYKDVLLELSLLTGLPLSQRTRPDSAGYYGSPIYQAIDHVVYRNGTLTPSLTLTTPGGIYTIPGQTYSGVLSNNLYLTYPELQGGDANQDPRIAANLQLVGSDHFPVIATFN